MNSASEATITPGRLIVLAAPSGAGKTSLVRSLLEHDPSIRFSISYTTRPPRAGEVNGRDYHFVERADFERMIDDGAFLEYAQVFDNFYGTGAEQVREINHAGHDVLLEIDWQGAQQVRAAMPECLSIFILPPSVEELERRLRGRSTDSEAVIQRRLRDSRDDMAHWGEFDYVVINGDFDQALAELRAILEGRGEACATASETARSRAELVTA
jgi:guanylate kinase